MVHHTKTLMKQDIDYLYYIKALPLFVVLLTNNIYTRKGMKNIFKMILKRQYKIHWLKNQIITAWTI